MRSVVAYAHTSPVHSHSANDKARTHAQPDHKTGHRLSNLAGNINDEEIQKEAWDHEAAQRLVQHRKALAKQKPLSLSDSGRSESSREDPYQARSRRSMQQSEETKR